MIRRWDEWSERLSALVLLAASVVVAHESRCHIAETETLLDRRERQLDQLAAWPHACRTGHVEPAPDLEGLFGLEQEVVVATTECGCRLQLRPGSELLR